MKKLVVLMLVLGMASLASATIADLEIRVGGVAVDEIGPGAVTDISITNNEAIAPSGAEGYFILVSNVGNLIDTNSAVIMNTDLVLTDGHTVGNPDNGIGHPAGTDGAFGGVFNFGTTYAVDSVLFSGIALTPGVAGTLDIYAIDADGVTMGALLDSVVVVPEPATIALLGLGGLLLRRRK